MNGAVCTVPSVAEENKDGYRLDPRCLVPAFDGSD